MFGHGQAYDGSQHTSQSPWSATPGSLQEATPQEHRHSQQLYPHASHYQHYTLAHATPAPLYTYPTSQEGFASEESANHPAPSSTVHGLEYAAQPSYDQQKHRLEQATDGEPPSSAGSVGSGSVSSGESAATTGPSNVSQQAKIHDLQHTVPQIPSSTSHTAPSASSFAQSQTSLHSSPLFDVPPGYRTMLSSDKSSSVIQHSNLPNETGGSAPARHNSMPSSAFSSAGGPLALSADVTNIGHLQPQYHSPSQPALQNQPQQMSYGHPPASSSTSSHPFLRTPVPHYTSSPASLLPNSFSQEPHQYQHSQLSPQDSHFHSASSSASGSGSSSLAAHSGSSASSGFQTGLSSDAGLSTKGGRYPLRHPHQSVDIEQSSSSQPSLQISNPTNAHFVAPAPPASAPATVSSFAMGGTGVGQDIGPQSHGQTGVTRLDGPDETLSKFPLRTSSSVSMTANSPSATHSRSPSVSSTSFSSFGPLSASTSSSASSSFGEFSTSITPRRAMRLSNLDRRALCQYAEANPRVKHEHIGSMFGVERSTVSKILKQKAKWFSVSDDNTIPVSPTTERKTKDGKAYKNRIGRYPEMEAMLLEWGKEQTRSDIVLTDEAVRSKALEFAEQLNIESGSFKASAGWLENFKERAKYKAGKFDLDAPPPSLNQSSASSRGPSEELIEGGVPATENIANTLPPGSIELIDRPDVLREGIRSDNLPSHMQPAQTSSSRAPSPLRHRRHKRGGLSSLSSSSISLPDLVEQEERQSINMSKPGSTTDLRSRGSSFSNLSMRPLTQTSKSQPLSSTSYSTDSSPYPSPTCSTTSDLSQRGLTASSQTATADFVAHTSTPTQRAVYDGAYTPQSGEYHYQEMHSTAPSGSRLQQAGINFNLSLNSSPSLHSHQQHHHLPTIEAGQPLHVRHLSTPYAEGPALSSLQQYPSDAYQGDTLYATRSRIHSAPGASLQPQQTYSLNHGDDLAGHSLAYHYGQADATSPAHQVQHAVPEHKAPLHRSQTDPMPLYPNMSTSDFVGPNSSTKHLGDSTVVPTEPPRGGDTSSMQVDIVQHSSQDGPTQFYHHPYVPQVGHVYAQIPHARRATVSSGGDLSFSSGSGTGSSHGHGYSYSLSAVTTPVYGTFAAADASVVHPTAPGENNKVSLHEAYLSLRRVVAFLQDNNKPEPPRAIFATSSQTEVLESVLAQLKQAHIDQIPTLTPPKS